jgi:phage shock protein A
MRLVDKLRQVVKTAVSDLFSEESETAVPDSTAKLLKQTQTHLDQLRNELAQAVARQKRAETAWRVAEAQGQPDAQELQAHYENYAQAVASLQVDIERLQRRLQAVRQRQGSLSERENSVETRERLQQIRRDLDKTAESLHTELDDRQENVAQREDHAAAREEIEEIKRRLQS